MPTGKIHLEPERFKAYMDNTTKWQRVAILMKIKLSELGHEAEASRIMRLTKDQLGDELLALEKER